MEKEKNLIICVTCAMQREYVCCVIFFCSHYVISDYKGRNLFKNNIYFFSQLISLTVHLIKPKNNPVNCLGFI